MHPRYLAPLAIDDAITDLCAVVWVQGSEEDSFECVPVAVYDRVAHFIKVLLLPSHPYSSSSSSYSSHPPSSSFLPPSLFLLPLTFFLPPPLPPTLTLSLSSHSHSYSSSFTVSLILPRPPTLFLSFFFYHSLSLSPSLFLFPFLVRFLCHFNPEHCGGEQCGRFYRFRFLCNWCRELGTSFERTWQLLKHA